MACLFAKTLRSEEPVGCFVVATLILAPVGLYDAGEHAGGAAEEGEAYVGNDDPD